jgi:hypothetical protein
MSKNSFFNQFPLITYSNCSCVDITKRISLNNIVNNNHYIYYPYDLQGYERADSFSNRYYGDSYLSWVLYLTNNIYDPLRGWYLEMQDFNELVTLKYDSIQLAMQKTKFYRNNWVGMSNIFPNYYDALSPTLQEYWQPVFTGNRLTSYERINVDWSLNTNRIIKYSLANTSFITDEVVDIIWDINTSGQGQVLSVDTSSNSVFVQHVNGYYKESYDIPITGNSYIYGQESGVNSSFSTNSMGAFIETVIITENLTTEEEIYWIPVTYYDYENEKNEKSKTLRVLDSRYVPDVAQNLTDIMSNM